MEFLDPKLEAYVERFTEDEPVLLKELNRNTWAKVLMPRMLAGHFQGRALSMISHMVRPKTVLEIGTYTGYSAMCWAEGLAPEGVVHTIEVNEELEDMIRDYFDKSDYKYQLKLHIGKALEIIPTIEGSLDIVYIDADKENYSNYYHAVLEKVRSGGYIIADNVLWSGKVLDDPENMDPETRHLFEYSQMVHNDERVANVLLPVRDGLMIARKK